jgi:hypothetical protein
MAGYQVAVALEDHTSLINRIIYAGVGVTTDSLIGELIGVSFKRATGLRVTAGWGQAETVGFQLGKHFVMAYVPDTPGRRTPSFGYEFVWPYGGTMQPVERWREDKRKSYVIRCSRRYSMKFITVDGTGKSNGAGYLIQNAIA